MLTTAATLGVAAPLQPKDVVANPALLAHVDIDALKNTTVGKAILADPDVQTKLNGVQAAFNFDFRTQLHGFTIYSAPEHSQDPALIIYADFDPSRLIAMAKLFPDFDSETNNGRVIYNWDDKKKKGDQRIYASIDGHRVIFGKTEDALLAALDVLDGKTPSFKADKALLPASEGELVVAEGTVHKFDVGEDNPGSAIFQASKAVRFKLGETGDKTSATVSFEAKDNDSANQVAALVNGLIALLKFQKDNPDALKLANAVNVRQDNETVILSLQEPSADLLQMLKHGAEEHKEKEQKAEDKNDANAPANASPSKS